jgi:hypothetical protein
MAEEHKEDVGKKSDEHPVFQYTVDDEPQTTNAHVLTPKEILARADLNPTTYYLVQIKGNEQVSYKDRYDEQIHMHQHMTFISVFIGETPVSELA